MSIFTSLFVLSIQSFMLRFFSNNLGRLGSIKLVQLNFFILMFWNYIYFFKDIIFQEIPYNYIINLGSWFKFYKLHVSWLFVIDSLSFTMSLLVLTISCFVHVYSITYLDRDPHLVRFLSYLSLFTSFMLFMVCSLNLLVFFIGWEGIGLCSYLLISFWYTRVQAVKAALKAILVNRIGDFFFLLGICYCFSYLGTTDIDLIIALAPYFLTVKVFLIFNIEISLINLIAFSFSIAAIGKSAQLGLHVWLPDAMEGPTPVSALIHAATMVTAGIYFLLRLSHILVLAYVVLNFLIVLGALTAFVCALVATVQFDIKKIIAYSTCSQLGYMILSIGLTNFHGSFYHLINHAFFKALLFLTAGAIIHSLNGEQDIRKMGGLVRILPFYYFCILISSLSMIGFFFFSGFYSKEFIINSFNFHSPSPVILFSYWLSIFTTVLTTFYSLRLIYEVFFGSFKGYRKSFIELSNHIEIPATFKFALTPLVILSIFSGYLLKGLFTSNSLFFSDSLAITMDQFVFEYVPAIVRLIPVFASLFGLFFFWFYYSFYFDILYSHKYLYSLLLENFFFSSFLNLISLKFILFTRTVFLMFDKGVLEIFGPSGIYYVTKYIAISMLRIYTYNNFFFHLFFICFNLLLVLSFTVIFLL